MVSSIRSPYGNHNSESTNRRKNFTTREQIKTLNKLELNRTFKYR